MTDSITQKFFDVRLWHEAIAKGVDKGIDNVLLRTLSDPQVRLALYGAVCDGTYDISAPRAVRIPKGSGAFATMKNLILFHNCRWHLEDGTVLDADRSFDELKKLNYNPATTGRQIFGAMLRLIADNQFKWEQF